jgi:putative DNA-invertase from lambdoid prophage Rac
MKKAMIIKTMVNGMTFDGSTKDPMQMAVRDALLGFMAAMAEMEIVARKEAMMAGIIHARTDPLNYIGRRPSYDRDQLDMVRDLLAKATPFNEIARAAKLSRLTVYRIRDNYAHAEKALAKWEEWQKRQEAKKTVNKLPFVAQRARPRAA